MSSFGRLRQKLHQKACRTCSTIIFLHSTNQIINLWRCRGRWSRHFFLTLLNPPHSTEFHTSLERPLSYRKAFPSKVFLLLFSWSKRLFYDNQNNIHWKKNYLICLVIPQRIIIISARFSKKFQ